MNDDDAQTPSAGEAQPPQAGWYDDPGKVGQERLWTGQEWTAWIRRADPQRVEPKPAGWRPHPLTPGLERLWSGDEWTDQTRPETDDVDSESSPSEGHAQTDTCPRCGSETANARFCPTCGLRLSGDRTRAAGSAVPTGDSPQPPFRSAAPAGIPTVSRAEATVSMVKVACTLGAAFVVVSWLSLAYFDLGEGLRLKPEGAETALVVIGGVIAGGAVWVEQSPRWGALLALFGLGVFTANALGPHEIGGLTFHTGAKPTPLLFVAAAVLAAMLPVGRGGRLLTA